MSGSRGQGKGHFVKIYIISCVPIAYFPQVQPTTEGAFIAEGELRTCSWKWV